MNPVIAAIANEMCRAVSMGAGSCGLTRWNAGHLPNDEVMRCAMLKCHHTSRRTAKWGELLTLQSSEGDDQLDYDSSWKINEACLRFDSQNGLEVTFQKRCADVQLLLAISSQLPSTLKRITLPNFPTNFPTFQLWTFFEVIDKKTMFLLLKQVQPTLNEVPRASTGCHASHDSRRFRQNQAEFEARFRRLDGDSSGKVRSLGMKVGFFQKRETWYVHRINKKQSDVIFCHFSYAGWDWVWWVREMVPTLRYTFRQHVIECIFKWHCMIGSCATKGVWWWGGVEKQKQLPLSSMEIRWLTPLQVEVVGSAEKVKRTFEDCNKDEMAEKILWNSQDAIERIAHSPVL